MRRLWQQNPPRKNLPSSTAPQPSRPTPSPTKPPCPATLQSSPHAPVLTVPLPSSQPLLPASLPLHAKPLPHTVTIPPLARTLAFPHDPASVSRPRGAPASHTSGSSPPQPPGVVGVVTAPLRYPPKLAPPAPRIASTATTAMAIGVGGREVVTDRGTGRDGGRGG